MPTWIAVHQAQERQLAAQRAFDEALRALRIADLALAEAERRLREEAATNPLVTA